MSSPSRFSTTVNRDEKSRRSGIEAEVGWQFGDALRLSANYSYLKATEPGSAGGSQVRELRRPKHSGSVALDGTQRPPDLRRIDRLHRHARRHEFRRLSFRRLVHLHSYWLGGARVAYAVSDRIELFARAANAFDARYQDVFGYRTEGRSLYAGIRLADRR